MTEFSDPDSLRSRLVAIALQWERMFGVAPQITGAISEYDAACLVGHSDESFSADCVGRTAVSKGSDFAYHGVRYQVKANRPSGKPGSAVTKVAKASNYDWDKLIWLLYDRFYVLQEAWEWDVAEYRREFCEQVHVRPPDMRRGRRLVLPPTNLSSHPGV
ncbi:MAG: hypothetical protein ABI035_05055 [Gemmatimonadaceae bacterium]